MNTFLIIIGIHALLVGFALLFAGIMSLAAPTAGEEGAAQKENENQRKKGLWRYVLFCLGQYGSAEARGLSLAASHWPERPESRRMIYIGLACLGIAATVGYHLGVFDS